MVSVDTWLNENSLDFFLYCLYASVKGKFFTNGVNLSFADDTEVSSGQLKRFKESLIDPEFSSNSIFSFV